MKYAKLVGGLVLVAVVATFGAFAVNRRTHVAQRIRIVASAVQEAEQSPAPPRTVGEAGPRPESTRYVGSGRQQLDCLYDVRSRADYQRFHCQSIEGPYRPAPSAAVMNLEPASAPNAP